MRVGLTPWMSHIPCRRLVAPQVVARGRQWTGGEAEEHGAGVKRHAIALCAGHCTYPILCVSRCNQRLGRQSCTAPSWLSSGRAAGRVGAAAVLAGRGSHEACWERQRRVCGRILMRTVRGWCSGGVLPQGDGPGGGRREVCQCHAPAQHVHIQERVRAPVPCLLLLSLCSCSELRSYVACYLTAAIRASCEALRANPPTLTSMHGDDVRPSACPSAGHPTRRVPRMW